MQDDILSAWILKRTPVPFQLRKLESSSFAGLRLKAQGFACRIYDKGMLAISLGFGLLHHLEEWT